MIGTSRIFRNVSGLSKAVCWLMLMVAGNAQAATGTWTTMAPMPTARAYTTSGAIGSKLYVVTGSLTTANEVYDATTDTWATKAPIPTDRGGASAGVIAGKLYIVGGCVTSDCRINTTNKLEVYDPTTDTWAGGAAMPTSRSAAAAGVIAGKLYVVGGFGPCGPCTGISTLEVYDPVADAWTTKAPMPTARSQMGGAVINGKLYVVGGDNSANNGVLATLEVYDPVTDTWTTKASMPTAREGVGAGAVDGILYAVSGYDGISNVNTVEAYDPATNTWSTLAPIPTARTSPQPQGISGVMYVAGNGANGAAISTLEAFVPPPIQVAIDIRPGTNLNNISLANDINVPVAILSSASFDAPGRVDKTSLTFGHVGSEASLSSCDVRGRDVNGDGRADLVCRFTVKATAFQIGDTLGVLTGRTIGGSQIHGTDSVHINQ